jgi:molybdopterin/thiamine biosynthesis adenylyltransferase
MARLTIHDLTILKRLHDHLTAPLERFAFMLCDWRVTSDGPIFEVVDLVTIAEDEIDHTVEGSILSDEALDRMINLAASSDYALVEAHAHGVGPPAFSLTDRHGLDRLGPFMADSLHRPYGATVWVDGMATGEWWAPTGLVSHGHMRSVLALDGQLRQLAWRPGPRDADPRFDRQLPLFGLSGQRTWSALRIGIVGLSGTGSPAARSLAFLGALDFVLVDPDIVEEPNLNRIVTATPADLGTAKVIVARRSIREISPGAAVASHQAHLEESEAQAALETVDVLIGCVDHDGARLLLNRLAIRHRIPYIDIGTGIHAADAGVTAAGARVAFVLPDGPCLTCTDELDVAEVADYFAPTDQRRLNRERGYVDSLDVPSPSVVTLNGLAVQTALTELGTWVAGHRPPSPRIDIDILGDGNRPGIFVTPRRGVTRRESCVECHPTKGSLSGNAA